MPICVGGGLRTIEDIRKVLSAGADKVAINTQAVKKPEFISEVARQFGSQCMVLSIEAKKQNNSNDWLAFTDNGREHTGLSVVEWAKRGAELGAGEILLTSIDKEGTRKGFDAHLIQQVSSAVSIPVIASGGMGEPSHIIDAVVNGNADAIAMADVLHYNRYTIAEIKEYLCNSKLEIRSL